MPELNGGFTKGTREKLVFQIIDTPVGILGRGLESFASSRRQGVFKE